MTTCIYYVYIYDTCVCVNLSVYGVKHDDHVMNLRAYVVIYTCDGKEEDRGIYTCIPIY